MTRTLLTITALQLFSRRRVILIALLALLPLGVGLLYRLGNESLDDPSPIEFAQATPVGFKCLTITTVGSSKLLTARQAQSTSRMLL